MQSVRSSLNAMPISVLAESNVSPEMSPFWPMDGPFAGSVAAEIVVIPMERTVSTYGSALLARSTLTKVFTSVFSPPPMDAIHKRLSFSEPARTVPTPSRPILCFRCPGSTRAKLGWSIATRSSGTMRPTSSRSLPRSLAVFACFSTNRRPVAPKFATPFM